MSTDFSLDQRVFDIAVASIRRASMNPGDWKHTTIGALHPGLESVLLLAPGEMVLASAFFSRASWYAFTTRRIVSQRRGARSELDPRHGIIFDMANFKGKPTGTVVTTEVGPITSAQGGQLLFFEFETAASMAPIYACRFWRISLVARGWALRSEKTEPVAQGKTTRTSLLAISSPLLAIVAWVMPAAANAIYSALPSSVEPSLVSDAKVIRVFLFSLAALVAGIAALVQIGRHRGKLRGKWFAISGVGLALTTGALL